MAPPELAFTAITVTPPPPPPNHDDGGGKEMPMEKKRSGGGHPRRKQSKRGSTLDDVDGVRRSRRSTAGGSEGGVMQKVDRRQRGPTLVQQAMLAPGRLRLRDMDPRKIIYKDCAATRVVIDPRKNRFEGACRLIERLRPASKQVGVQYSMKMTGKAKDSTVPPNNGELSDDDYDYEESDDEAVNSEDDLASLATSGRGSKAGSQFSFGLSAGGSVMSKSLGNLSARQHKMKAQINSWLGAYSGCTKGHGERLMNKIYFRRCRDLHVKMNSGVTELLLTAPPCFCSLQAVNLSHFLIGNRGVQGLWPLLRYARALKALNLAGNGIRDLGMRHIISIFDSDFYQEKNNLLNGLLVLDLSDNPITGGCFEEINRFYDKRQDVLLLGLARTELPSVKRQRLVKACLAKFASSEPHLLLEAWRLTKEREHFFDRELFFQCERIVEATHGQAIHDMVDMSLGGTKNKRHVSWNVDESSWDREEDGYSDLDEDELDTWGEYEVPRPSPFQSPPDSPSPSPDGFRFIEGDEHSGGPSLTPTPPPIRSSLLSPAFIRTGNPFQNAKVCSEDSASWASRRQRSAFNGRCKSR